MALQRYQGQNDFRLELSPFDVVKMKAWERDTAKLKLLPSGRWTILSPCVQPLHRGHCQCPHVAGPTWQTLRLGLLRALLFVLPTQGTACAWKRTLALLSQSQARDLLIPSSQTADARCLFREDKSLELTPDLPYSLAKGSHPRKCQIFLTCGSVPGGSQGHFPPPPALFYSQPHWLSPASLTAACYVTAQTLPCG